MPICLANPQLLETLEQFAQNLLHKLYFADTCSDKVARRIGTMLFRGDKIGIDIVSKDLAQSSRSLQNRLKVEGTSFQKLFDQVRKELALNYLKDGDTAISEIAFLLGFSEQSAFNHAFKRWTGTTPRKFATNTVRDKVPLGLEGE